MLVLDFDGTITDAELEGAPFRGGYLEDLAVLTGLAPERVLALAQTFEAEILADPDAHGWIYAGQIVAPAAVDPYLRMMPVARRIFDEAGVFRDDADRSRLLDGILYKYNYTKTNLAFRDGAFELLSALVETESWIVTNSHTEPVQEKLRALDGDRELLPWWTERVRGRAQKYIVDDDFKGIDATLDLPGLNRPVLLRRPAYVRTLQELLADCGQSWSELWVFGDIFELDLAVPLSCGAKVGLVVNEFTPDYEREFVANHERGHIVDSLSQILGLIAR